MSLGIVETLSLSDSLASSELSDRLRINLSPIFSSESREFGSMIRACYDIYYHEFKKQVRNIHLKGLKLVLAALDKSNYYKRHPAGRMELDQILAKTAFSDATIDQKERNTRYEMFTAKRFRTLSFIIESVLFYSNGKLKKRGCSSKHLLNVLWLAEQVVHMAYAERTLERVSSDCIESIWLGDSGEIGYSVNDNLEEQANRLQRLYSMEHRYVTSSQVAPESTIDDLIEGSKRFDQFYMHTRGFTLSNTLKILQFLILGFKTCYRRSIPSYVCQVDRSELVRAIVKSTDIPKDSVIRILQSLFLTSKKLRATEFPEWHSPRELSIWTCPILSFKVGAVKLVCFSEQLVGMSAGLMLSYPLGLKDRTHGDKDAEKYKRELTEAFEEEIADKFNQYGFSTHQNIYATKRIGEIDVLAYHEDKKLVAVVECKAPKVRLDPASIAFQKGEFEKWVQKIKRKTKYVCENLQAIHGCSDYSSPTKCMPIIVTRRPWATIMKEDIEVVHLLELDSLIKRITA